MASTHKTRAKNELPPAPAPSLFSSLYGLELAGPSKPRR